MGAGGKECCLKDVISNFYFLFYMQNIYSGHERVCESCWIIINCYVKLRVIKNVNKGWFGLKPYDKQFE